MAAVVVALDAVGDQLGSIRDGVVTFNSCSSATSLPAPLQPCARPRRGRAAWRGSLSGARAPPQLRAELVRGLWTCSRRAASRPPGAAARRRRRRSAATMPARLSTSGANCATTQATTGAASRTIASAASRRGAVGRADERREHIGAAVRVARCRRGAAELRRTSRRPGRQRPASRDRLATAGARSRAAGPRRPARRARTRARRALVDVLERCAASSRARRPPAAG